jgi:hypothetical protein
VIEDPKIYACAYFGYRAWGDEQAASRAYGMIEGLAESAVRGPGSAYWGYNYTWATRGSGSNPRGASTIVPGAFAVVALLHDLIKSGNRRHAGLVSDALDYYAIHHLRSGASGAFLGYFANTSVNTHNANLLGCAALSLGGRVLERDDWLKVAASAATSSVVAIDETGYLPYADHSSGGWTDCFHHLYVIACVSALRATNPYADASLLADAEQRLRLYLKREFIRTDGLINYYPGRLYPIDPHNYAAAAIFARLFGQESDLPSESAKPLLSRLDELMWDPSRGRYLYRRYARRRDRRLFVRWTQAWMFAALAVVLDPREKVDKVLLCGIQR